MNNKGLVRDKWIINFVSFDYKINVSFKSILSILIYSLNFSHNIL